MTGLSRKKILVIDDSPLVLELTRGVLEEAGYAVAIASNLTAFEEERRRTPPDLILVDVQMPEAFGDDVASTLRGAYGVTVPILLVSTLDDAELASRAIMADCDGYVSKRGGLNELVRHVRSYLEPQAGRGA